MNRKILLLAASALLAFACEKTVYPEYEWGAQEDSTKTEVFFTKYYQDFEIDPEVNTLSIELKRKDIEEALSVPLIVTDTSGVIGVPETAEFAAGDSLTTITIDISKIEIAVPYGVEIAIPADYYNFYKTTQTSYYVKVVKQKWNDVGTCTFADYTFSDGDNVAGVPIQQLDGKNQYRMIAPYYTLWEDCSKVNLTFTLDEDYMPVLKDGLHNIYPEYGYMVYYDTVNYPGYCYIDMPSPGVFEVNHLIYEPSTGKVYGGGCFKFAWDSWPGAEE